jgi:hypothetical protein
LSDDDQWIGAKGPTAWQRACVLLRPLASLRIHGIVAALPILEWWGFRMEMETSGSGSETPWAAFACIGLQWGGHEALFVLALFAIVGLAIPGRPGQFLRLALVPLGVVAVVRVYIFLPWWVTDPESFRAMFSTYSMFAADLVLAVCVIVAVRGHLVANGSAGRGVKEILWPGAVFVLPVVLSSWLRVTLTGTSPGGPFAFDNWWISVHPSGLEILRTLVAAWITALPILLLARWLSSGSALILRSGR